MSIVDEVARLQELRVSGALTEDEFTAAKAKLLAEDGGSATPSADVEREVRRLGIQNEILRLDQDWAREQDSLMLVGKGGSRTIPSRGRNAFAVIFISAMGLIVLTLGLSAHFALMIFMVVAVIALAISAGVSGSAKADIYEQAKEQYQRRRAELADRLSQS